jgi:lysozyme
MTYTVPGCDISIWNNDGSTPQQVDFQTMLAKGAKFVFIKTSQATFVDRDFTINWNNAKKAGIARGGYHYLDWARPAIAQAQFFAGVLQADPGELPPTVDFEEQFNCPANAESQLKAFLDEFNRIMGKKAMIYTSPGYWNQRGSNSPTWLDYKLWLAHYTTGDPIIPKPWTSWTFWQHTSQGVGPEWGGEAPNIDLNWYHGSEAEFCSEFNLGPLELSDSEKLRRLWEAHPELH